MVHIGIDLGTTNSAMATYDPESETAEIVENFDNETTTPSVVQVLEEDDEVIVGEKARNQAIRYPDKTFFRTKPDMGTDTEYEVDGETYRPEQIAAHILSKLKTDAEDNLGEEVEGAVITVPYYFGTEAREATKDAARIADLDVYRVMNEPTAACYAYGMDDEEDQTLLVYDLGGGTFDATIVEVEDGEIEVVATDGDKNLGGENFDDALYDHVREQVIDEGAEDPNDDSRTKWDLRDNVKDAKEALSQRPDTVIAYRTDDFYEVEVTAEEFQGITQNLVDDTVDIINNLFAESDYEADDIDNVLMVGGSTRMPHVRETVEDELEMEPSLDANPDEIVARGAALDAATFDNDQDISNLPTPPEDILSHSLGVEVERKDSPNQVDHILNKGEKVPVDYTKQYGNPHDREANLIVNVIEGEEKDPNHEENNSLDDFVLQDVPGDVELDVNFFVKDDGTLDVTAEAVDEDIEGEITIEEGVGLTDDEISEMQDDHDDKSSSALGADD